MRPIARHALLVVLFVALGAIPVIAQEATPRVGYVFPAGGKQGTELTITVGGQRLDGVVNARVSGMGVQATVVEHIKPLSQGQASQLREKLRELQEKRTTAAKDPKAPRFTAADARMAVEISRKLATSQRRPTTPAIAETVILHVVVAKDAEPGQRELRLGTSAGLSNPVVFWVGQLPELTEEESESTTRSAMNITVPAIVNGQVMPGDEDRFSFKAKKGDRLVVAAAARELVPYLPDAVPGWFQATLALYDVAGNELAFADHHRFHPDPVLVCKIPKDGVYTVEIRDAIYRGREDFVYRIAIGEMPFITSVFPLGAKVGTNTTIELRGWNLPLASLSRTPEVPGLIPLSVRREDFVSNRVPFSADTLPECLEEEPNNTREAAMKAAWPTIVNGRIDYPGDVDVLRFEGRAGQEIVAEVLARRLVSPMDSVLKLTDAAGKQLAYNDDHEDKGAGLMTHHADSLLTAKLPADGTYYLHIADAQRKGGMDFAYRVRLSAPRPDFELRVVPSSVSVRAGSIVPLTVYALRRDGFNGDIQLALKNPPAGFNLSGAWVPAGQDRVRLTLTAMQTPQREHLNLFLEGKATAGGQELARMAVPAEDMMQAFAYRHLVPAQEMKVVVAGRGAGSRVVGRVLDSGLLKIVSGQTAVLKVEMPAPGAGAELLCELSEPPEGISVKGTTHDGKTAAITIQCDSAKAKAGLKGNLIVNVFSALEEKGEDGKPKPAKRRTGLGMLPAVGFEVVGG